MKGAEYMRKTTINEVETSCLFDHRAVKAWQRVAGEGFLPERIETLKLKEKSAVYRLCRAGPDQMTIIAKRCGIATGLIEQRVYEQILVHVPPPNLRCLGFTREAGDEVCWLFLEEAAGKDYSPACDQH